MNINKNTGCKTRGRLDKTHAFCSRRALSLGYEEKEISTIIAPDFSNRILFALMEIHIRLFHRLFQ